MGEYQGFEIDMNMENVEAWDGRQRPLLPIGVGYHFKIVNVENDGKQITVQSEVLEGEHAGSFTWNNYNYTHTVGMKRLKALMVAVGASLGRISSDELMGGEYYGDIVHNEGKATPDELGNPREPKTFANVINERAQLDEAEAATADDPPPPPITRSTTTTAAASASNGAGAGGGDDKPKPATRSRRA